MNKRDYKKTLFRLQEMKGQAEQKKLEYERSVIECMSTEELKEICAMYDNDKIDENRINEIWERAENEYKSKASKKA